MSYISTHFGPICSPLEAFPDAKERRIDDKDVPIYTGDLHMHEAK